MFTLLLVYEGIFIILFTLMRSFHNWVDITETGNLRGLELLSEVAYICLENYWITLLSIIDNK